VAKKFTTTVVTTISTAMVEMTAPYCTDIGTEDQRKWCTPLSG